MTLIVGPLFNGKRRFARKAPFPPRAAFAKRMANGTAQAAMTPRTAANAHQANGLRQFQSSSGREPQSSVFGATVNARSRMSFFPARTQHASGTPTRTAARMR